jgi:hypothetical protein
MSEAELLTAWERSLGQPAMQQAMVLLAVAFPEYSREQLAQFSIGRRDALLLTLRERLFGSQLNSIAVCPRCRQPVELAFDVSDIRVSTVTPDLLDGEPTEMTLVMEGCRVSFRLPNSLDLASIETIVDVNDARDQLLRRCVQVAVCEKADSDDGEVVKDVSGLPITLADTIIEHMAQADPQADTRLALNCPNCNHEWSATFDIATYLTKEVQDWVKHILREIHNLARAYSWREADILAMSPTRRRAYMELLGLG